MKILSTKYDENKKLRVISFDNTGKILEISSRKPIDENTLFAYFEFDDVVSFITGESRISDHIVKKTSDVFIYEIVKTKVSIKKRVTEGQLFHIEEQENAEIDITFDGEYLVFKPNKDLKENHNT
jgi:RNase P/RNase MRP subunit p29